MAKGLDLALDPPDRDICYVALGQMYTFFAETVLEPLTWPVLFKTAYPYTRAVLEAHSKSGSIGFDRDVPLVCAYIR